MAIALPEPDPLLGFLTTEMRDQVRQRFIDALEKIYNPPRPGWVEEYQLGHVRGEARARVLHQLSQAHSQGADKVKAAAKRSRDAREALEDSKARVSRLQSDPGISDNLAHQIATLNSTIQQDIRKAGAIENEIKGLKAQLKTLNEEIGRIQDLLYSGFTSQTHTTRQNLRDLNKWRLRV